MVYTRSSKVGEFAQNVPVPAPVDQTVTPGHAFPSLCLRLAGRHRSCCISLCPRLTKTMIARCCAVKAAGTISRGRMSDWNTNATSSARWPLVDVRAAVLGGVVAAAAATVATALLRWTWQVRSLPERLIEWLLLFVPLDTFEAGIRQFGFDAKRYALYATILVLFLLLAALGAVVLWQRWSLRAIVALAVGLWLMTMVAIMPLTGAGVFALGLLDGPAAAIGGYLAVALIYAASLALVAG